MCDVTKALSYLSIEHWHNGLSWTSLDVDCTYSNRSDKMGLWDLYNITMSEKSIKNIYIKMYTSLISNPASYVSST